MLTAHRRLSQFYHVLLRLLEPRHPPNALTSLTTRTVASLRCLELVSIGSTFTRTNWQFQDAPADGQVVYTAPRLIIRGCELEQLPRALFNRRSESRVVIPKIHPILDACFVFCVCKRTVRLQTGLCDVARSGRSNRASPVFCSLALRKNSLGPQ